MPTNNPGTTNPSYPVLAPNTQPLQQSGLGDTRTQTAQAATNQGASTPEDQMNSLRKSQGLAPIQYGPYASPASSTVATTDQLRAQRDGVRDTASSMMSSTDAMAMNTAAQTNGQPSAQPGSSQSGTQTDTGDAGLNALMGLQSFGDTAQGQQLQKDIQSLTSKLSSGELTPEEQAKVQAQVDQTKAQYDALIAKANQEKTGGMAKDLVAAGQRGGLMNTQFAGQAALTPVNNGTFVGAGGELNRIQSEYDLNIQNLQAQQIQAVNDARTSAQTAIRTGTQEDLKAAQDAYDFAQKATDSHNQMVQDKVKALADYQAKLQTVTGKNVDDMVKAGIGSDGLDPEQLAIMDQQAGYPAGTTAKLLDIGAQEKAAKDQAAQVDLAGKLSETLQKIPVGQSVTVGGVQYTSLNQGKVNVYSENDGQGNTTIISYNQDTGEMSSKTLYGVSTQTGWEFKNQNGVGLWVNPNTQQTRVAFDANQMNNGLPSGGIAKAFPDGTYGGQCGVFAEQITTFAGKMGDTFQSKMKVTDPSITPENVTPGNIAILNLGSNGHAAVVLGTTVVNGKTMVNVLDSNYHEDGKTLVHTFEASQIGGFIPAQLKSQYQFGSGAGAGQTNTLDETKALADFGGASGTAKPLTTNEKISLDTSIKNDPEIKAYRDATAAGTRARDLEAAVQADPEQRNVVDNAIIDLYQKSVNPGAIVRDPTVMRIIGGQSALEQLTSAVNKAASGGAGISDAQRETMVKIIESQSGSTADAFKTSADQYKHQFGLSDEDFSSLFPEYSGLPTSGTATLDAESIKQKYPNYSSQIDAALSQGYTPEEISSMLSNQ